MDKELEDMENVIKETDRLFTQFHWINPDKRCFICENIITEFPYNKPKGIRVCDKCEKYILTSPAIIFQLITRLKGRIKTLENEHTTKI